MRVLSVTHGPSVPGGVFDEAVEAAGHELERWQCRTGAPPTRPRLRRRHGLRRLACTPIRTTASPGSRHEEEFLREVLGREVCPCSASASARRCSRAPRARRSARRASPRSAGSTSRSRPPGAADPVLGVLPPQRDRLPVAPLHVRPSRRAATELARSDVCTQAFRLDGRPAWGIQFHAEVTLRDAHGLDRGGSRTTCRCPRRASVASPRAGSSSRTSRGARCGGRSSAKRPPR